MIQDAEEAEGDKDSMKVFLKLSNFNEQIL